MGDNTRTPGTSGAADSARHATTRFAELGERVLKAAPVVILLLDADGAIQYVNPYFERLTGYRLDEIQGKDWFSRFLPGEDQDRIRMLFRASFTGERVRGNVNPIVTRAGEVREIDWTDELLRDAAGTPMGLLAIGHDVTERKAVEDALRTSEQRLAEAQRIASIGAWELDLRTGANWWSDEQYRIHGVRVGTPVTQQTFLDLIHPDDRATFEQAFSATLVAGVNEMEFRIVRADGQVRDLYGRAKTTCDAHGTPVTMAGTNQDITERKRTEADARRASELLHTVVSGSPVVLFALDRDGVITFSEGRALAKFGVKPGELIGTRALDVYAQVPGFADAFRRALAGQQTVLTATVGTVELEAIYTPSVDARGRIDGVIGVGFDVTKRRRAEAKLQASVTAQERLVEELRDANHRKSEFIAVLSHELRNPLAAIRNGLHVVQEVAAEDGQARRATEIIERQVTQLARLVDDLLDVSRITQNKVRLQRTPLDVVQLVSTLVDDHQAAFASNGVRLEARLAGMPLIVNGDAARLTQVIGNLLHNAVKFTPPGGLTTVSVAEDADGRVVLRVADTGAGIDPTMIDRLFQPFAQADRTLARSMGGLGLGLALVKGLVELHGGEVSVRSAGEGTGAEFVVHLPLDRSPSRTIESRARGTTPPEVRRILIIEDNSDAAEALGMILELDGHQVEIAHDGVAGLRTARELRPDVVLCDLGLPGMSGFDVARELKRDEALASTQLIALSGYAAPEDVARALSSGFDQHLAKPIVLERLRGVISGTREPGDPGAAS